MRQLVPTVVVVILCLSAPARVGSQDANAGAARVVVRRDVRDPYWVTGRVVVRADPDVVWSRLRQVDRWRTLFHDIHRLRVVEHQASRWRVELGSTIMDCGPHDYLVRIADPRTIHLVIDAPGVDARGRMVVRAGPEPGSALVIYQLRVQATGVASWFVSEDRLRGVQERIVERYLRDIRDAFPTTPAATGG